MDIADESESYRQLPSNKISVLFAKNILEIIIFKYISYPESYHKRSKYSKFPSRISQVSLKNRSVTIILLCKCIGRP